MKRVFLDYNATTPPSKSVLELLSGFKNWGNASSIHGSGRGARAEILKARRAISTYLGCSPGEVIFTSGGSEANNMAIKGLLGKLKERGQTTLICSAVEHPSVLKTLESCIEEGFNLIKIPVSCDKGLDYSFLEKSLKDKTVGLVSLMFANNETGEVFDLLKVGSLIKIAEKELGHKIYFHSDLVQSLGKVNLDFMSLNLDLASFSSHKFYALQGSGFLYQKKGVGLKPLIHGGGQERGRRAGTENLVSIASLGLQVGSLSQQDFDLEELKNLRDYMESEILKKIPDVSVLVKNRNRLPNTSLLMIEGVHGESLLMNLDIKGFDVSTGAACSSGNPEPSPVLLAMGFSAKEASKSLRLSIGRPTTKDDIDLFVSSLCESVTKLRGL